MNPLYLLLAVGGLYGFSRMSAASTAAAKQAVARTSLHFAKFPGPNGAPGSPLAQLQAIIKQGQDLIVAYTAATDKAAWLTQNHNAAAITLNGLNSWATRLLVAGQSAAASQGPAYYNAHPEMHPYQAILSSVRVKVHSLVYQDAGLDKTASGTSTASNSGKSAKDLLTKAQGIVNSFPSDGSDASAYVAWIATTAAQVPSLVTDIQSLVANAGNAQSDIQAAMAIIPQLTALVSKATSSAASAPSGGTDTGTTPSTDTSQPSADYPSY